MLLQYDKDSVSEKVRRELKRVISDPAFTPEQVSRVQGLVWWIANGEILSVLITFINVSLLKAAAGACVRCSLEAG